MRTNQMSSGLINSNATKRKGPPYDWATVQPHSLSQNSLRKNLFLPSNYHSAVNFQLLSFLLFLQSCLELLL